MLTYPSYTLHPPHSIIFMLTLFSTMSLSLDDLYKLAILHKVFGATNIYTTTTADVEGDHRSRHGKALFSPMPAQKRSVSENLVGGGVDDEEEERDEDSLHQHFYRKQPRHLEPDQVQPQDYHPQQPLCPSNSRCRRWSLPLVVVAAAFLFIKISVQRRRRR